MLVLVCVLVLHWATSIDREVSNIAAAAPIIHDPYPGANIMNQAAAKRIIPTFNGITLQSTVTTEIAADINGPTEVMSLDAIAVTTDRIQEVVEAESEAGMDRASSTLVESDATPKRSFTRGRYSSKDWIIDKTNPPA